MPRLTRVDGLHDKHMQCIDLLVWSDKTKTEIAREIGIDRVSIYRWYQDDIFIKELNRQRQKKFAEAGDVAQKELMKLLKDSSDKRTQIQAIKMVLGENGLCNDRIQVDTDTTNNIVVTLFDSSKEDE